MIEPAPEAVRRSGVTVAFPVPADDAVLAGIVRERPTSGGRFATGEGAVIALLGFGTSGDDAVVALERVDVNAVPVRDAFEALLGFPVRAAVRVETFTSGDQPQTAVAAEQALLALVADLARALGGVVRDDIGAFYELRELEALAADGTTRFSSIAFVEAAARLSLTLPVVEPAAAFGVSPPASGDARTSVRRTVFVCMAPFVCVGGLVRIASALDDAGREVRARPVVFAPVLDARHALVLGEAGVDVARTPDALAGRLEASGATADVDSIADELDVFSREADRTANRTREIVDGSMVDLAAGFDDSVGANAMPSLATIEAFGDEPGITFYARYAYPNAVVDVRSFDLDQAHPLVRDAVAARTDVALLLGGPPSTCTALAFETPRHASDAGIERADVFGTALAAEICGARDVATDAFAALFTRDQLVELALERQGHGSSRAEMLARLAV